MTRKPPLPAPGALPDSQCKGAGLPRPKALKVRPYDHPLRFMVESETDPAHPHLVDLAEYAGNGGCSCRHFACRLIPELRQGRSPSNATRCKHILHARHFFTNLQIKAIAAAHP